MTFQTVDKVAPHGAINDKKGTMHFLVCIVSKQKAFQENIQNTINYLQASRLSRENIIQDYGIQFQSIIEHGLLLFQRLKFNLTIEQEKFDNVENFIKYCKSLSEENSKRVHLQIYFDGESLISASEWYTECHDIHLIVKEIFSKSPGIRWQFFTYNQDAFNKFNPHFAMGYIKELPVSPVQHMIQVASYIFDVIQKYVNLPINFLEQETHMSLLAHSLVNFLSMDSNKNWLLFYYAGSPVASFIDSLEILAMQDGIKAIKGPNEHSLMCGAISNWLIYSRPSLIVVTNGMISEFKGTLANIKQSKAKGFIVFSDSFVGNWFQFQASINPDDDIRDILTAYKLPWIYMENPAKIHEYISLAFEKYHAEEGPVVIVATQRILEYPLLSKTSLKSFPTTSRDKSPSTPPSEEQLRSIIDVINHKKAILFWHCGILNEKELKNVLVLSEKAGIGLADSINKPGTIPHYYNGKKVSYYLGADGIYGVNEAVYRYLFDETLLLKEEKYLFYIKSKITQIEALLSPFQLKQKFTVVQVNKSEKHIAPCTDFPILQKAEYFLDYLCNNIQVDPEVLQFRQRKIQSAFSWVQEKDVLLSSSKPFSSYYFCYRLNRLVEAWIQTKEYRFKGVYEAGRFGVSAFHTISRTSQGFSGFYGRAFMGDALLAAHTLALTANENLLCFIGDGAKNIVPDILPTLIENILNGQSINHNITFFIGVNNSLGLIHSYNENILGNYVNRQSAIVNLLPPEKEFFIGQVKICYKTITEFDDHFFEATLLDKPRINFYSVLLEQDGVGDGLGIQTYQDWRFNVIT